MYPTSSVSGFFSLEIKTVSTWDLVNRKQIKVESYADRKGIHLEKRGGLLSPYLAYTPQLIFGQK